MQHGKDKSGYEYNYFLIMRWDIQIYGIGVFACACVCARDGSVSPSLQTFIICLYSFSHSPSVLVRGAVCFRWRIFYIASEYT